MGVVRMKNWGGQKWTSEVNDHISGFIYMVLKSRCVFQTYIFQKLSNVLHSVHWYMYMFMLTRNSAIADKPRDTLVQKQWRG